MDNGFNNGYYRLGDIGKLYYSKKWVSHNNGLFPIYGTGGIISLTNKPTFEPNSIILPRVGTLKIYFSSFKHSTKNTAFSYKTKNPKLTKYIYYKLHKIDFLHQNEGSAVPRLTSKYWKSLNIFLPSLSTQQKIIDIIEPHQELYLKFSNCIRIDTYENAKHDMQILIDIIEPIEKLENTITKFNKHLDLVIYWLIKRSKHIKELSEISQIQKFTKLINKRDLSENGKYYYSTGKTISKNKKTNLFNFDNGVSIAYEGSVIDGKYLSPQIHLNDLYIARKWGIKSIFYFSIFYSMKFTIAQPYITYGTKMISISHKNLEKIPIYCANEKENNILKKLHLLITKINNLKNKLAFLKNKLLQLLIK